MFYSSDSELYAGEEVIKSKKVVPALEVVTQLA